MKTYQHKGSDFIAKSETPLLYWLYDCEGERLWDIPLSILLWDDRKEVIEKDWIDEVIKDLAVMLYWSKDSYPTTVTDTKLRYVLEKYMPKITEEEYENYRISKYWIRDLLKERNLYKE